MNILALVLLAHLSGAEQLGYATAAPSPSQPAETNQRLAPPSTPPKKPSAPKQNTPAPAKPAAPGPEAKPAAPKIESAKDLGPLLKELMPPRTDGGKEVVAIRMRGVFSLSPRLFTLENEISPDVFNLLLDLAEERRPAVIVLAIDSPGGSVAAKNLVIDRLLKFQTSGSPTRIVAWVDFAASAAALTALSVKDVLVTPTARMGSATTVTPDGEQAPPAATAMENKIAALDDARKRQIATITGRPVELLSAMQDPTLLFWAHPTEGFSLTPQDGDGWRELDGSVERPLALQAEELLEFGIASAKAGSRIEVLQALKLPDESVWVELDLKDERFLKMIEPARQESLKRHEQGVKEVERFLERAKACVAQLEVAERTALAFPERYVMKDLANLRTQIDKCSCPHVLSSLRTYLEEFNADALLCFDQCSEGARRSLQRAKSTLTATAQGLTADAVATDLQAARLYLELALKGCKE